MKKFLKWCRLVCCLWYKVLYAYFAFLLKYSRHPERYPLSERYARVRGLIVDVCRHLRIELKVQGIEYFLDREDGSLLCGNHIAVSDVLLILCLSEKPISFVGKKEVKKIPVVGRCLKAIDGLFLDRSDPRQAIYLFREADKRMKEEGLSYVIFPEGTRAKGKNKGKTLPFHPGSFKIAYRNKGPIVLYAGMGTDRLLSGDLDKRHYCQLSFFPPLTYEQYHELSTVEFAEKAHGIIEQEANRLREEDKKYYLANRQKQKLPALPKGIGMQYAK